MAKPGVTQELRSRVSANIAEETKRRRITTAVVVLALVGACLYFALRWLL